MENKTEVITQQEITPMEIIMAAVTNNADLDKVEKLLMLRERDDAFKARKAYAKSFSIAQSEIQSVAKNKFNPQTKSKYADLAGVIESAQPIYTKEGFSVTFDEGDCPNENHMRNYAHVLHSDGHKETYHLDMPLDGTGIKGNANMTAIHGKASTSMYSRRYLMCMIWNIPTTDDDGNKTSKVELITEKQLSQILDLLASKELTEGNLLKFLKIEKLENLPSSEFMKALSAINSAVKKEVIK